MSNNIPNYLFGMNAYKTWNVYGHMLFTRLQRTCTNSVISYI